MEDVERLLQMPVGNSGHAHARDAIDDLIRQSLSHKARANHGNTDGLALFLTGFQCIINEDHTCSPSPFTAQLLILVSIRYACVAAVQTRSHRVIRTSDPSPKSL